MDRLIIASGCPAHPPTKLFNINPNIPAVLISPGFFQLADRSTAVYSKMESNSALIFIIEKAFILMQVLASQLPAPTVIFRLPDSALLLLPDLKK